jgi:hypothetical protein
VDGQAVPVFRSALLKLSNFRVVHILFLIAQKVITDRVDLVGTQLVITMQNLTYSIIFGNILDFTEIKLCYLTSSKSN